MKLTNKQLSLIAMMIFEKVDPIIMKKCDKEKEVLTNKAIKIVKSSDLYKKIVNAFKALPLETIRLSAAGLCSEFTRMEKQAYAQSFSSPDDFVKYIATNYYGFYKTIKRKNLTDISNKLILSSINITDINALIDSVSESILAE